MATNAQINANRENAKQSTGPRTPEGKERSSKNALKHGLLALDSVIPGEDPADFDRHLTLYEDTYNPANCVERELVLQIADSAWRMRRLSRIEATVMTAGIERTRVHQETFRPERTREGHEGKLQLLGASMLERTKLLNNLARYDGHLNRRFHRAVELMIKIRREERKLRDAENKATNRDRGVDPSPGSAGEPAWDEVIEDYGPREDDGPVNQAQPTPIAGRKGPASVSKSASDPRHVALREKLLNEANALVNALKNKEFPDPPDERIRRKVEEGLASIPSR